MNRVRLHLTSAALTSLCAVALVLCSIPQNAPAQDNPPTPFEANFNDQTGGNNYGGGLGGFYGGGDSYFQNDSAVAFDYNTAGPSGVADDYAMRAYNAALAEGANYTFFGCYLNLRNDFSGVDLTGFATLSFDIKAGTTTAHNDYVVRLEDTDGTEEYNNTFVQLPTLTTDFQTVTIPLTDFTGGAQPVDLSIVKQITFVNYNNLPAGGTSVEMDLIIDNIQISGTAPEPTPLPPPLTDFYVNFDNSDRKNSEGGDTRIDAGYGGTGGFVSVTDQITTSLVTVGPGDLAYQSEASITNGGDGYSYAAWFTKTDPTEGAGRNFSRFSLMEIEAAVLPGNNLNWRVRLEDSTGDPDGFDHYDFNPPLSTTMQTYQIPMSAFLNGDNGTKVVDITDVWSITFVAIGGTSTETPTLNIGLQVSRISLITPTGVRHTLWQAYE